MDGNNGSKDDGLEDSNNTARLEQSDKRSLSESFRRMDGSGN